MTSLERWHEGNNAYLASALKWLRLRLLRVATPPRASIPPEERSAAFELAEAELAMQEAERIDPPPALIQLRASFGMSLFEQHVLMLCAGMELDTGLGQLCGAAQGDPTRAFPTLALAFTLFDDPAWESVSPARPLRYWRLLEVNQIGTQPFVTQPLRADERVVSAIKGLHYLDERLSPLLQPIAPPAQPSTLPPSQMECVKTALRALRQDPRRQRLPVLQLVGTDGPSKRELATELATELGLSLFRLPAELLPAQALELESLARIWQRENLLLPLALYVDALELERPSSADGLGAPIARFLSHARGVCFLDTREAWSNPGAPAVAIEVEKPTPIEQRQVWSALLEDGAANGELPSRLSSQFNLGIADIESICRTALAEGDAGQLGRRLWAGCLERTRPRLDQLALRLDARATWDDIVLPSAEVVLLRQIAAQVRKRSRVYDDWGFRERMNRGLGISVLFAGESGTGKTMAAEVIANEVELDLYRIDLSAVVSKYIGETEKNLRRMFDAAEDGGAILFFDEADALFGKRSEVKDSHDRYANIEVNYLLQRMEAYAGLAILATNMKGALDQAFMRRLRFIVNFPIPGVPERKRIWRRVFPEKVEVHALDYDRLARFNLSGGSISNVALSAAFLAADQGSPVTMPLVLDAARSEFKKLDRPINEADFRWDPAH
jgi:hypothetical protein